jgi:choline kinase
MQGLILAAGRGSRLGHITDTHPKCLTPVNGITLLARQLKALKAAGIDRVAAATGYQAEQIAPLIATQFINDRWADSNMVRSLYQCAPWLEQATTIVSYSDIIYSSQTVTALSQASGDIVISYDPLWLQQWQLRFADPLDDAESFVLNDAGQLCEIGQSAESVADIQGQYMGLLKFTPAGWRTIASLLASLSASEIDKLDMTALLNMLLAQAITIDVVACEGFWFEVDNPEDLAICEAQLTAANLP